MPACWRGHQRQRQPATEPGPGTKRQRPSAQEETPSGRDGGDGDTDRAPLEPDRSVPPGANWS